ncbi:MAG: hypothetical protein EON50_19615 [Acidovorax sp.]|nr:MAG: hypothetical protein EON50_19615 [Acidovorax sp.]
MTEPPGLLNDWRERFGFLETELGFVLTDFCDSPTAFDNCVAQYTREPFALRLARERGQVFVELRCGTRPWLDKEPLLDRLGIGFGRHPPAEDGSWSGYHTAVQARDLQHHLPLLLRHMAAFA